MNKTITLLLIITITCIPLSAAQDETPEYYGEEGQEYTFNDLVQDDPAAALQQNPAEAFHVLGPDATTWTPEQRDAVINYFKTATPAQFDQVKSAAKSYFEAAGNFRGGEGQNYVNYLSGGAVSIILDGNTFAAGVSIKGSTITKGSVNFVLTGAAKGTAIEPVKDGLKITVPGSENQPLTLPTGQDITLTPRQGSNSFDAAIPGTTQFIISPDTVKTLSSDAGSVTLELQSGQSVRVFKDTVRLVDASGGNVDILSPTDKTTAVQLKHRGSDWDTITLAKDSLITITGGMNGVQVDGKFSMLTRTPGGAPLKAQLSGSEEARDGRLTVYIGSGNPILSKENLIQIRTGTIGAGQMPLELTGRAEMSFNRADGSIVTVTGNVYTATHGADESGKMVLLRAPTERAVVEEAARKAAEEAKRYDAARKSLQDAEKKAKEQLIPDLKKSIDDAKAQRDAGQMSKDEFKAFEKRAKEDIKAIEKSLDRQDSALDKWRDSLPRPVAPGDYRFSEDDVRASKITVDIVSETIVKDGSIASISLTAPAGIDSLKDIKSSVKLISLAGSEAIPFSVSWGSKSISQTVDPSDPTKGTVVNERGKTVDVLRGTITIESRQPSAQNAPAEVLLIDSKGNPVVNKVTLSFDAKGVVAALGGDWGEYLAARTKEGRVDMGEITQAEDGTIKIRGSVAALDPYLGKAFFFWSISNMMQKGLAQELQSVGDSTLSATRSRIDAMMSTPGAGSDPTLSLIPDAIADRMQRITSLQSEQLSELMRMKKVTDMEVTIIPPKTGEGTVEGLKSSRTGIITVVDLLKDKMPAEKFNGLRGMSDEEAVATIKPYADELSHWWVGSIKDKAMKSITDSMPEVGVTFTGTDKDGKPVTLESGMAKLQPTQEQLEGIYTDVFLSEVAKYAQGYNANANNPFTYDSVKADALLYKSNPSAFTSASDPISTQFSLTMLRIQRAAAIENMYRQSTGLPQ